MGLLRLIVFGFIGLSVIYFAISVYARSLRRESLEDRWAEKHPGEDESPERDAYIEDGMARYNAGIRPKLLLLIYVVPTILVILALILTNWN
ncbi:MAG: hypothetical protein KDK00_11940 [Rhodobacteraceae bacterium]|nr:hypothetical protein [Paracoccaceae bacterium]